MTGFTVADWLDNPPLDSRRWFARRGIRSWKVRALRRIESQALSFDQPSLS